MKVRNNEDLNHLPLTRAIGCYSASTSGLIAVPDITITPYTENDGTLGLLLYSYQINEIGAKRMVEEIFQECHQMVRIDRFLPTVSESISNEIKRLRKCYKIVEDSYGIAFVKI